jgi:DNA-binding XRE family transcriptional regulator
MNAEAYKRKREWLGYTQAQLAGLLGVNRVTVAKRESGAKITMEAWLALSALSAGIRPGHGPARQSMVPRLSLAPAVASLSEARAWKEAGFPFPCPSSVKLVKKASGLSWEHFKASIS